MTKKANELQVQYKIINVWPSRCYRLAYKMMVNKFDRFEKEHEKEHKA